ncbi:2TM domain-containing protein [Paenimyroides aquimaris]|uniref:2TM domain-containing protein n=1 Tax=Paenimyroides marinum TaxID=1159016 RepID=A0A1H6KCQ7_9FLAO|nr:2TM domain-containing protein [Paenimyroides aquimaris]SEH72873.1 2TM domain-containing protein [Paenimyroides aquimaris]
MENYSQIELLKAKKKVKKVKGFYIHLIVYLCVNSFFIIITLIKNNGNYWFLFPLIGWGIGLFSHAAGTFNFIPFLNKEWENKKIIQYMEEERNTFKK